MDNLDIYIGLGSNIGNSTQHINDAVVEIKRLTNSSSIKVSSLYQTAPMGPQDQPDYINAVMKIQNNLAAIDVLDILQKIEHLHGRIREKRWAARTLDLDILLYGQHQINNIRLKIPHPGLYVRAFVLYPLLEIEPKLILPNGMSLIEHVASMGAQDIKKLL